MIITTDFSRPDMTFAVDWALNNIYLSTYLRQTFGTAFAKERKNLTENVCMFHVSEAEFGRMSLIDSMLKDEVEEI